jgi:hypothetical protein
MLFTGSEWTTIVSDASVVVVLGTAWRLLKKADPKLASELPKGVQTVLTDIEDIGKSPWFATEAAAGKVELKHIEDKLLHTTLAGEIAKTLAAARVTWVDMSEIEKGTLITEVQAALAQIGVQVTPAQITADIAEVERQIATVAPEMQAAADRAAAIRGVVPAKN